MRLTRRNSETLEMFARRVETRLKKSTNGEGMERLICRLLTGEDQKVAAALASRWVDWRYGKPTEHVKIEGHIEHTTFDASRLTDEQLAEADQLIESASVGSDPG